jgi:hypothetical protein
MNDKAEQEALRVLAVQGKLLNSGLLSANAGAISADDAIADAEALLAKLGTALPQRSPTTLTPFPAEPPRLRSWREIADEARNEQPRDFSFDDIMCRAQWAAAARKLSSWNSEFAGLYRLTRYDYAVAGAAGVLAALADILLVQVPKHPGFLGGPAAEGGWLSNAIKERFSDLLPEDTIHALERDYPVPFDPSTSYQLAVPIEGLGPRTHRMNSLGHDPLLGWVFGVRDVLMGGFTAIGSDGRLVVQTMSGWEPAEFGVGLFVKILEAFKTVAGHLLSDVATKAGLPPPLFGLLQFIQQGGMGNYSIADIARAMYRSGYDFRHFLAGGVTVTIIEAFVRTAWIIRELSEGKRLSETLPETNPRLRSGLFLSHSVATAVNAGKLAITQNPLAINWAQWLAFFRYLIPQMYWLLISGEDARTVFVQDKIDRDWTQLDVEIAVTWTRTFGSAGPAVL